MNHFEASQEPVVEFIKHAMPGGPRVGVFASSFNPPTTAHVELVQRAADSFLLDQSLALAGKLNADKRSYDCPLETRLKMLQLAFDDNSSVGIGVASHAFFVDMVDAIERAFTPPPDIYFIVGFDTFVRILDPESRYTGCYYQVFKDRTEALMYLLSKSRLIVAARAHSTSSDVLTLMTKESEALSDRVLYLDLPADLAEQSATRVREMVRSGMPITGLVPAAVERLIERNRIYGGPSG